MVDHVKGVRTCKEDGNRLRRLQLQRHTPTTFISNIETPASQIRFSAAPMSVSSCLNKPVPRNHSQLPITSFTVNNGNRTTILVLGTVTQVSNPSVLWASLQRQTPRHYGEENHVRELGTRGLDPVAYHHLSYA